MKEGLFYICIYCILVISCVEKRTKLEENTSVSSLKVDALIAKKKEERMVIYDSVVIGGQVWMAKNLDVVTFKNGDSIFNAKTSQEWLWAIENKIPAWCYYNNDKKLGNKYGVLYNCYAFTDKRQLAPKGWILPNMQDWNYLSRYPQVKSVLKITKPFRDGASEQIFPEYMGSMQNGVLRILPSGWRFCSLDSREVKFIDSGRFAKFWTSYSESCIDVLHFPAPLTIYAADLYSKEMIMNYGLSVRCIKRGNASKLVIDAKRKSNEEKPMSNE